MTAEKHFHVIGNRERHVLTFDEGAICSLQAIEYNVGNDVALHVALSQDPGSLVISNYVAGAWQAEEIVPLDLSFAGPYDIILTFDADGTKFAWESQGKVYCHHSPRVLIDQAVSVASGDATEVQIGAGAMRPLSDVGVIDFGGVLPEGEVIICGWCSRMWSESFQHAVTLRLRDGDISARAEVLWYERPDLENGGIGYILIFPRMRGVHDDASLLSELQVDVHGWSQHLVSHDTTRWCDPLMLRNWVGNIVPQIRSGDRDGLRLKLERAVYSGQDTLGSLPTPFHFEVDASYIVPGVGTAITGWMLDPHGSIASLRLCSDRAKSREDLRRRLIVTRRNDVVAAFGDRYDLSDDRVGFVALALDVGQDGAPVYLEAQLASGEIGFKPLARPVQAGMPAIRRMLGDLGLSMDTIRPAFDDVLGPMIQALNKVRLGKPLSVGEVQFGTIPEKPRCSIIVPLYGRLDFVEYQCAIFSRGGIVDDELIYVLDEPGRKVELLAIAESCYKKYKIPMRIVLPSENLGFGPASNLGLKRATGEQICFLNSDIFPKDKDWLDRLCQTLQADPSIGAVGAICLFADGSVQHLGMAYEPVAAYAGWRFPKHPAKGMRLPAFAERVSDQPGITGACMVMRRALALELGGFDIRYVIGDFEDADLCKRILAKGLRCVVDNEVMLYHLERQSQGDQANSWRMNLTLCNAWLFNRRWYPQSA